MKRKPIVAGIRRASDEVAISQSTLRAHVRTCADRACEATRQLQRSGARLVLGMGRHCELAVVAAAGPDGIDASEIVVQRRRYAAHLGIKLDGPVKDAETPVHILFAVEHAPDRQSNRPPIKLGTARAVREGTRYVIRFARNTN